MPVLALVAMLAATLPAGAQTRWRVMKAFHIGGPGGWDYVTVDAPRHRLFVTRSTHTQAIDLATGKVLADIPGQIRSHGVALVPRLNRGFISDGGGSGAIIVFDMKTYKVLGRIPTIPDTDGIIYDPKTDEVLADSGDGSALMAFHPEIDPEHGTIRTIALPGKPEFLAADGAGRVYVNIPPKNEVAVVDLPTRKVIHTWSVAPGGKPVGMAIDPARHLLFIGCRNPQKLIVLNTQTGKVVAALPLDSVNDAVRYANGHVFASCGGGSLTIASEKGGHWAVDQVVKTAAGARTLGLDRETQRLYLPTARFGSGQAGHRPPIRPGTFEILVVVSY